MITIKRNIPLKKREVMRTSIYKKCIYVIKEIKSKIENRCLISKRKTIKKKKYSKAGVSLWSKQKKGYKNPSTNLSLQLIAI